MRHEGSKKLFQYWNEIREDRPAPERSEVEPNELRSILGDTFILEISQQFRSISYRLAGTRLCAAYGRELKGLGFLALWDEEDNYDVAKAIYRTYQDFQPVLLSYIAHGRSDRFVEYEALALPLLPTGDGTSRVLGIASPKRAPSWLGGDPLLSNHLRHARPIDLAATADRLQEAHRQVAPSLSGPDEPRRFGHLTLLDGGLS